MAELLDQNKIELLKQELGSDVFVELVNIYASELRGLLIELEDRVRKKSNESVNFAHSIKGISSNMGAIVAKEIAGQIEMLSNDGKYSEITVLMGDMKLTAHQTIQRLQKFT